MTQCGELDHFLVNKCESEIERRMLIELLFADWGYSNWLAVALDDPEMPYFTEGDETVTLAPQLSIGSYRADIAVIVKGPHGKKLRIAVECDGHDFHEKTKAQAERDKKRDRDMQKLGWMVFRFTGSELFRLGRQRAEEVAAFVRSWLHKEIG
jgi:very-short-patch-repair endonuclease